MGLMECEQNCSQLQPCPHFLPSSALGIIMTYSLSGSSRCPWEPVDQVTDIKVGILESLPQSSRSSSGRHFKPLPCHLSQESILGCILCTGMYSLLYALEILFIIVFSSHTESHKTYSVCPLPVPPSPPQEQSKSFHTDPAAAEGTFPEASIDITVQDISQVRA